jgi:hypothetical protein
MKPVSITGVRGIVNVNAAERLQALPTRDDPLVDLVDAVNVDIDDTGRVSRRAGQSTIVAGSAHSLYSNGDDCLYVQDGNMYRLDRDLSSTLVAAGLDPDPVAYVSVGGRIYHANGISSAVFENGRVRSWGIPIDDTAVVASATTGALPAGAYLFAMTLIRRDGQESGCGMAHRIDLPDNSGLNFTWSVPRDMDITQCALYLTQADGETLLQAAVVDVEDGQYTYTGGPRSLPLATQWLDKPPAGSALALYRGRIYIAYGAHLFATSALSYEHCDMRDYRAIDGNEIQLLAAVDAGLFVSTRHAVYFLSGASFADNAISRKYDSPAIPGSVASGDAGVITGNAQLAGQAAVVFATTRGIVLGLPDGSLLDFTSDTYQLPAATRGAALLRSGKAQQYLVSLDT